MNSDIDENNLNMLLKRVDKFLKNKHIFCKENWLKEKINQFKQSSNLENEIYKEVLSSDIEQFINKEILESRFKDVFNYDKESSSLTEPSFSQIIAFRNIAEPLEKQKEESNLDVLDNFESKFLEGDSKESKKIEKEVFKLELFNGVDNFVAFEYTPIRDLKLILNNKHPKILIHAGAEVRRGIVYLRQNLVTLL
jgi:hypothetical protein